MPRLFDGAVADAKPPPVRENIVARLVRGGYPEANRRASDDRRGAWFASYLSTILQRSRR